MTGPGGNLRRVLHALADANLRDYPGGVTLGVLAALEITTPERTLTALGRRMLRWLDDPAITERQADLNATERETDLRERQPAPGGRHATT